MIRKLQSGKYRLDLKKPIRRPAMQDLGTFETAKAAAEHERAVQYFKHAH